MPAEARRRDQLIGLFAFAAVLFDPPMLGLFSGGTVLGWPLLYLYVFVAWGGVIALLALVVERRHRGVDHADDPD
jgi:hypothetical protein